MLFKLFLIISFVAVIFANKFIRSGFCKTNTQYICGPEREVTCNTYNDDIDENAPCVEKCHCKEGFAKNATGHCIPFYECPLRQCPLNSNYDSCGPLCQRKCISEGCQNDGKCHSGCFCRLGYVLDDEERRCIKLNQCPRDEDRKAGTLPGEIFWKTRL